ncbi:DegV family protein, partial [Adlercreutzia rubneri]|uniref:DegV family protein n=1 Tax=Adlercreutzia rubneri TaxID=2916441 RepID=UPI0023AF4DBC
MSRSVPRADIAREASELHNRSHASFVLDTMEFLAAGGRCPTLVAYLGGKLSCRPGILVDNQSGAMKVGKLPAQGRAARDAHRRQRGGHK